jgi:hypothetical protein
LIQEHCSQVQNVYAQKPKKSQTVGNYGTESHESGKWFPDGRAASESFTNFSRRNNMKKFTGFIAAAAIAFAPMSASALTALTDNAMNDVTGQAGVSITVDDVVMETWVGTTMYTDLDGSATGALATGDYVADVAASLVISNKHTIKTFQAITGYDAVDGLYSPGIELTQKTLGAFNLDTDDDHIADAYEAHAIKIDVGTLDILSDGKAYNNGAGVGTGDAALQVTGVVIGLPTLEINTSSDTYTVGVVQTDAVNQGAQVTFIQVTTGAKTQHILGGVLEIAPH